MRLLHIFLIIVLVFNFNLIKADEIETENKIAKNLRCLICQGQSVYDSDSEFALSLKLVIIFVNNFVLLSRFFKD